MNLEPVRVGSIEMLVRPDTWDADIVREVVQGDCYRCAAWLPLNPVVIFDVGGHIGSFSKWMGSRLPKAKIFTFEMDATNAEICTKNTADLPNVTVFNAALGPRSGDVVRGPVHAKNTGGSHVNWNEGADGPRVAAIGIANFLAEHKINYVDCMKLDCEGSEFSIIDAMTQLPGGLRKWVGGVRAELHAKVGSPEYAKIVGQLEDAFPFVSVSPTSSESQHYLFAWR